MSKQTADTDSIRDKLAAEIGSEEAAPGDSRRMNVNQAFKAGWDARGRVAASADSPESRSSSSLEHEIVTRVVGSIPTSSVEDCRPLVPTDEARRIIDQQAGQIEMDTNRILELVKERDAYRAALEKIAEAERMGYGAQRTYGEMAQKALNQYDSVRKEKA